MYDQTINWQSQAVEVSPHYNTLAVLLLRMHTSIYSLVCAHRYTAPCNNCFLIKRRIGALAYEISSQSPCVHLHFTIYVFCSCPLAHLVQKLNGQICQRSEPRVIPLTHAVAIFNIHALSLSLCVPVSFETLYTCCSSGTLSFSVILSDSLSAVRSMRFKISCVYT